MAGKYCRRAKGKLGYKFYTCDYELTTYIKNVYRLNEQRSNDVCICAFRTFVNTCTQDIRTHTHIRIRKRANEMDKDCFQLRYTARFNCKTSAIHDIRIGEQARRRLEKEGQHFYKLIIYFMYTTEAKLKSSLMAVILCIRCTFEYVREKGSTNTNDPVTQRTAHTHTLHTFTLPFKTVYSRHKKKKKTITVRPKAN